MVVVGAIGPPANENLLKNKKKKEPFENYQKYPNS